MFIPYTSIIQYWKETGTSKIGEYTRNWSEEILHVLVINRMISIHLYNNNNIEI